jgi:phage shock protein A
MGFLTRVWQALFGGKVRETGMLAQRPEARMRTHVRTMETELGKMEAAVAQAMVEERKLAVRIQDLIFRARDWEHRARLALSQGRDDLAREAILQKCGCENEARTLTPHWERQKQVADALRARLNALKPVVDEHQRGYQTALARLDAAQAEHRLAQALAAPGTRDNAQKALSGMNDRITQLEAESQVALQLAGVTPGGVDQRFLQLEQTAFVEQEMARLRLPAASPEAPVALITDGSGRKRSA